MNQSFWHNRRIFLTGHTGFKGGWLALWLNQLGAKVYGYALPPSTNPNFYTQAHVKSVLNGETIADIRDIDLLKSAIDSAQPEIVFHLAAQPLVRYSYVEPVETYSTNVIGTVNVLEAARHSTSIQTVLNITTDKCYENKEKIEPYKEIEALGGFDPYSSSKACSELVTLAYRRSFLEKQSIGVASARAGNVIGGGDWTFDRLIPDFLRAVFNDEPLIVRYPEAIRPWQHVLEPLSGYMLLAEMLHSNKDLAQAWNFGPDDNDAKSVQWVVEELCKLKPETSWIKAEIDQPHEAGILKLDSSKAKQELAWSTKWSLATALQKTLSWHESWLDKKDMKKISLMQINEYMEMK